MIRFLQILGCCWFLFFLTDSTLSRSIDLGGVTNKKTVDMRQDFSPSAWRMVVLLARDGNPGHAYVAALTFREDINSFVTDGVFGLYPAEQLNKWVLGEVKGVVDIENSDRFPDTALIVWTNPQQHAAVLSLRNRYQKEGTYSLLVKDCVSLVADSARLLGLKIPSLLPTPYEFVQGTASIN